MSIVQLLMDTAVEDMYFAENNASGQPPKQKKKYEQ